MAFSHTFPRAGLICVDSGPRLESSGVKYGKDSLELQLVPIQRKLFISAASYDV